MRYDLAGSSIKPFKGVSFSDSDTNDIEFTMTASMDDPLKGIISDGTEEKTSFEFSGTALEIKDKKLNGLSLIPNLESDH